MDHSANSAQARKATRLPFLAAELRLLLLCIGRSDVRVEIDCVDIIMPLVRRFPGTALHRTTEINLDQAKIRCDKIAYRT